MYCNIINILAQYFTIAVKILLKNNNKYLSKLSWGFKNLRKANGNVIMCIYALL